MNINLRYVAYAKAHGRSPEVMMEEDDARWPGGRTCGFILWISQKWQEWDKIHNYKWDHVRDESEHDRFDAWLDSSYGGK